MTQKQYKCSNDGCENLFTKAAHNQKYCSDECCREATNAKIKQKQKDKKDRLSGKERICKTRGCKTVLSRYSDDPVCMKCKAGVAKKELHNLLDMIKDVSS